MRPRPGRRASGQFHAHGEKLPVLLGRSESRVLGPGSGAGSLYLPAEAEIPRPRCSVAAAARRAEAPVHCAEDRFRTGRSLSKRNCLLERQAGRPDHDSVLWASGRERRWPTPISICPTTRKEPRCTSPCWASDARRGSLRRRHSIRQCPAAAIDTRVQSRGMVPITPAAAEA